MTNLLIQWISYINLTKDIIQIKSSAFSANIYKLDLEDYTLINTCFVKDVATFKYLNALFLTVLLLSHYTHICILHIVAYELNHRLSVDGSSLKQTLKLCSTLKSTSIINRLHLSKEPQGGTLSYSHHVYLLHLITILMRIDHLVPEYSNPGLKIREKRRIKKKPIILINVLKS